VASSSLLSVRARITSLRLPIVGLAAVAIAATVLPTGIGSAAPASHLSLSQVEARISVLNTRAERITETFDSATTQLKALQGKQRVTDRMLASDRSTLATVQQRVAAGAAAAYKTGGLDPTLSLVSSGSPQTFIDQTAGLDEVARYEADQVSSADAAQRAVASAQVVHNAQVAAQRKVLSSISSAKTQIEGLLSQQRTLLSRLKASQRARLAAQQATTVSHEVAQRTTYNPPVYNGAASGRAAVAISFAYAQLGKPYQWGGAGPDTFDCSGLVMRAWGAAGVGLPHSAAGDQAMLPAVSLGAMEPGDLVFYGRPAFHVAIYIGGGRIIQAPHTGADVEIASVGGATSAGRP
jgi:cell wall-associated NlpC family hydrolase